MWLLVYLCSGVNIKDIVKLQYKKPRRQTNFIYKGEI